MCTSCGCHGDLLPTPEAEHGQVLAHVHGGETAPGKPGGGAAPKHEHEGAATRTLQIERDILAKNAAYAARNRRYLQAQGILALNLVSGPGAGKTTLLCATLERLEAVSLAVIEGDQQTSRDAQRVRACGAPAVQINTGRGCHLDAHMVGHALADLNPEPESVLMIENVGNLVCPALFDLGEAQKVVLFSVTEGEDKPLKYPEIFRAAGLMLLSKVDLLPHLSFDVAAALAYARQVNPRLRVICLSAVNGVGMDAWLAYLREGLHAASAARCGARVESGLHTAK